MFRKVLIILGMVVLSISFFIAGCKNKSVENLYSEGVQQLRQGNPYAAIVLLKNLLEKDNNHIDARFQLAKAYAATVRPEQAEKEFLKVLRQKPARDDIKLELAKLYCASNKPEAAILLTEEYLEAHPDSSDALELMDTLGYALLKNGRTAEACNVLGRAASILSNNPTVNYHLALALRESGNKLRAVAALHKSLDIGNFPEERDSKTLMAPLK